jgi:hypothetical protein
MHVSDRPRAGLAGVDTSTGAMQAAMNHDLEIVLKPLSRPDLGEIRIGDGVFAIGRNEQPFASYEPDVLAMLSRRHARISPIWRAATAPPRPAPAWSRRRRA